MVFKFWTKKSQRERILPYQCIGDVLAMIDTCCGARGVACQASFEFCRDLPKIELHAHLYGSIRPSTLRELAGEDEEDIGIFDNGGKISDAKTLSECFDVFQNIRKLTTRHEALVRVTKEILEDFDDDGVIYLELRSTPKSERSTGMTKRSYLEAILNGVQNFYKSRPKAIMVVRLILTIDRAESLEEALETVALGVEYQPRGVVGIDLAGNPAVGDFHTLSGALEEARKRSLGITVHAGELMNADEARRIVEFAPNRVSHMCFSDESTDAMLLKSRTPLELCLTSNTKTKTVLKMEDHHFKKYYQGNHPIAICTGDRGMFSTSLSNEYWTVATTFNLNSGELMELAEKCVDYIFADRFTKNNLKASYSRYRQEIFGFDKKS